MPIYEYQCDSCGYQFEVKQSIKDAPLNTCERCGKSLRRLISSPGLMFKGSGWYVTDYAGKSSAKDAATTESTPAAKKDSGEAKDSAGKDTASPKSSKDKKPTKQK